MATIRQKTSFGPGKYRGQLFNADRLRQFAEGTNKAIAAGVPIPLLKRHAKINADDKETLDAAQLEGAGWLTKVDVEDDGSLAWEAKDVPEDVATQIASGTLKFTSPEFRSVYTSEKEGVYNGPIIRHFAFTPLPGNPHQGVIETVALEELPELGAFQFAEEERELVEESETEEVAAEVTETEQHAEKPGEKGIDLTPSDATRSRGDSETPLEGRDNPDMPPVTTDKSKAKAVMAGLARKGVVLPSDFDFTQDSAIDILLAAINSSLAAESKAEAESADDDADEEVATESAMPFAEGKKSHIYTSIYDHDKDRMHSLIEAHGGKHVESNIYHLPKSSKSKFKKAAAGLGYHFGKHWGNFDHDEDSQHGEIQFSEDELAALPEKARNALIASEAARKESEKARLEAEAKAVQFAEQEEATRNNAAKEKAIATINGAKLPPAMAKSLLGRYEGETAIQFAEGSEPPTFTAVQVAEMFAAAVPPALRFSEEDTDEAPTPKANKRAGVDANGNPQMTAATSAQFFEDDGELPSGHISAERAEELFRANPLYRPHPSQRVPSIDEQVAAKTAQFPSQVMRG